MENEPTKKPVQTVVDPKDVEENKIMAVIAYLGILCLVPLLLKKDSPYAQFHGKQGLVLLIVWVVASFIIWIPLIGWAVGLGLLVLMIVGILNALNGEMKELPILGEFAKKIKL